ncbi:ornithine cyclodeaminase family protein [Bacillus thuringiensis]|uniref:ornithine cyclodeaminase family protein n=1 Tax=Bacillus thuringiensis TaxID=1428 RepID=UPI000E49F16A|nr:ornithine cyclodeaminase family protein [Bacillus thuringiensis]MDZ3953601.1 ornithine cyclodeaminase family protein [Bacillus thuringiensis]RGP43332.1 ornithine cyclodeaminase family protein [Bacillus thuringiensis]
MFKIRVLSNEDVKQLLKVEQVIDLVETVYKSKSESHAEIWPTIFYDFEPGKADMDIKSGYLKSEKLFGHKTVTWFGDNKEKGIPTLIGMIVVFDAETGKPLGITDASFITGIRTGAAGAIGIKYLARKNSKSLLVLGAGNQAIFQIASTLTVLPDLKTVRIAAKNKIKLKYFVSSISQRLQNEFGIDTGTIIFEEVEFLESAVKNSDIIITLTPSKKPVIKNEWVQKGTHISCIGADMAGKQEIESDIMSKARIFVDDIEHCVQVGEIEIPLKQGIITESNIAGEIGDLIIGKIKGRANDEQITVFDATGMALFDIYIAKIVLKAAEEKGLGVESEI